MSHNAPDPGGEFQSGSESAIFAVPAEPVEREYEVKKSRFIARAEPAASREQALQVLERARRDYPDARHHCWAYLVGSPRSPLAVAMSDDGEPGGTAGKPILNVLQHKGVGDVMLVVSRYFGGIKLGAGGLVRAYSQAAQQAMLALPTRQQVPCCECRVQGGFELEQPLRHWLAQHDGELLAVDYGQQIDCRVRLPQRQLDVLAEWVTATGGWLLTDL